MSELFKIMTLFLKIVEFLACIFKIWTSFLKIEDFCMSVWEVWTSVSKPSESITLFENYELLCVNF